MAISATVEWDIRQSGSDTNGGGFNASGSSAGTDYSLQDAAQISYTDLVIDATLNTKVTSAGNPFTSAHVRNIINITGGTGFTTGRYEVTAVAAGVATLDRAVGTTSSTGGTGKLGGSLATIGTAVGLQVGSYYIKGGGTFTLTSTVTLANPFNFLIIGYNSTHNDTPTAAQLPVVTSATNSIVLFTVATGNYSLFRNIKFTHTAGTRGKGIDALGDFPTCFVQNCVIDGCSVGIDGNSTGHFGIIGVDNTEIKNCTGDGINSWRSVYLNNCYVHDNGGHGISMDNAYTLVASFSIFDTNASYGINLNSGTSGFFGSVTNCIFYANQNGLGGGGSSLAVQNCVFYGQSQYGTNTVSMIIQRNNSYGSNSSGNHVNTDLTYAMLGDITLSANPFVDASNGDFSLNNTAGGGTLLKGLGFPGAFISGLNTAGMDVGAVQTPSTNTVTENIKIGINEFLVSQ